MYDSDEGDNPNPSLQDLRERASTNRDWKTIYEAHHFLEIHHPLLPQWSTQMLVPTPAYAQYPIGFEQRIFIPGKGGSQSDASY